jgi:hypothetical protein
MVDWIDMINLVNLDSVFDYVRDSCDYSHKNFYDTRKIFY